MGRGLLLLAMMLMATVAMCQTEYRHINMGTELGGDTATTINVYNNALDGRSGFTSTVSGDTLRLLVDTNITQLYTTNNLIFSPAANVGIGTTNPQATLHVEGDLLVSNFANAQPQLLLSGTGGKVAPISKDSLNNWIGFDSTLLACLECIWQTNGAGNVRLIDTTLDVGIGTTSPQYALHVANETFAITGTNGNGQLYMELQDGPTYTVIDIGSDLVSIINTNSTLSIWPDNIELVAGENIEISSSNGQNVNIESDGLMNIVAATTADVQGVDVTLTSGNSITLTGVSTSISTSTVSMPSIPTSAVGLSSGDLFYSVADSTLKIVP